MIKYGDILKDQTGQVMERGENACFVVAGQAKVEGAETDDYAIMEVADDSSHPMNFISPVKEDTLDQLKYVGNLCKMVWEEI